MAKLESKIVIVTGAASGIGRASAELFAKEGAFVVVADWQEECGRQTAEGIQRYGGKSEFVRVDISQQRDVEAMVDSTMSRHGRIDVMFNNAGVEGDWLPTADCSIENFDRVIGINLRGTFLCMKYGIPALLRGGGGVIINMASVAGLVGVPGFPAYSASKGGIVQLTKAAALEYAEYGIRVNVICPGGVETPMTARLYETSVEARERQDASRSLRRMGQPEEIARLALFLASDDSSFCSGAPFVVDGGFVAG